MPIFALPLAPNAATPTSRLHLSSNPPPLHKRKRSSRHSSSSDRSLSDNEPDESTNPLSLTPSEIAQYRLAGLKLTEQIPGRGRGFPHRALPENPEKRKRDRKGKGKEGAEEEAREEEEKKRDPRQRLRAQHLSVLTAILHKCLLAGDIPRASRAWAMLIRAEVNGQPMDIRGSGYWGIGAELLIRGNVAPPEKVRRPVREEGEIEDGEDNSEPDLDGDENIQSEANDSSNGMKRWGTRVGLKAAKNYFERLILQYPYKRQFPDAVTGLDFWPAMVCCEIYGIQWEEKAGLQRITDEEGRMYDSDNDSAVLSDGSGAYDDGWEAEERRRKRRVRRRWERWWQERHSIRQKALSASEKIATRLDGLMNTPPYSDSHVLLKLRGMLALYIGNLCVPEQPIEYEDVSDVTRNGDLDSSKDDAEQRRLILRRRSIEHEKGKDRQREERKRAKQFFNQIVRDGGNAGVELDGLLEVSDEENDGSDLYDADA